MTWNNYPDNWKEILAPLVPLCQKGRFQTECGENGTNHIQGCIELKRKMRWSEFHMPKDIHWEKVRNISASENYCQKDETSTGDRFEWGYPEPLRLIDPTYVWEQEILSIVREPPDDRTIHWYWSNGGCKGKTAFAKYLAAKFGAVPLAGNKNDVLYTVANFESKIYIWDIPRAEGNKISYDTLEAVKNGFFMCAKYESRPIVRNPPHIFVFANQPPKQKNLSMDRWHIRNIDGVPATVAPTEAGSGGAPQPTAGDSFAVGESPTTCVREMPVSSG